MFWDSIFPGLNGVMNTMWQLFLVIFVLPTQLLIRFIHSEKVIDQQFPLMPYESCTSYVGGISLGHSTPHLSLLKYPLRSEWMRYAVSSRLVSARRQSSTITMKNEPLPWHNLAHNVRVER
jgi:hypothetical protein